MMWTPARNNLHRCRQSVCREEQHAAGAVPDPDSDLSDDDWPAPAAAAPATLVRQCINMCHCPSQRPALRHTSRSWRGRKCAASVHVSY